MVAVHSPPRMQARPIRVGTLLSVKIRYRAMIINPPRISSAIMMTGIQCGGTSCFFVAFGVYRDDALAAWCG